VSNLHNKLVSTYLSTPAAQIASSQLVFHQLQQNDPERLLQILVDFYLEDENNLGRVVEIAMEAKVSTAATNGSTY
jgi:CCR4-NOT transcription complex subunit 1